MNFRWVGEIDFLRNFLIYLSESQSSENFFRSFSPTKKVIKRFIAGDTVKDGISAARDLKKIGADSILDLLGESGDQAKTEKALKEISSMIQDCKNEDDLWVGLKPTQLGLSISKSLFEKNLKNVYKQGLKNNVKITIDMEDSRTVDDTISVFKQVKKDLNLGICLQAYLRRTRNDLHQLFKDGLRARICKGAYNESPQVAFESKKEIDESYMSLAKFFLTEGIDSGGYPEFATHDPCITRNILDIVNERNIPKEKFEFQMLYGVNTPLQNKILKKGWRLRVYVPFGESWYPYFMRRLAERPANLFFFLRAIFGR
tara:strand:- start:2422 stop:3366 length:945 start_codon:yes stop_codon:yes gene_type:complete